jgi:predicted PurR-regulated permease PerM
MADSSSGGTSSGVSSSVVLAVSNTLVPWRSVALFLLTVAAVITCVLFSNVLLFSLAGAVTLAVVTNPLAAWLKRRCSTTLTATVLVVLVSVAVLLPLGLILRELVAELMNFVRFVASGTAVASLQQIAAKHQRVGSLIQRGMQQVDLPEAGKEAAGTIASHVGQGLQQVAKGVTNAVLLLFFFFFCVRDTDDALAALKGLVPLHAADTDDLLQQAADVVQATFGGRIVIALIQGALAGGAYLLLGVPGALLWSAVTAVCCVIPAFGAFLAWVPIALYLGLAQSWTKAGLLAAWGGIVVSNVDNVLYPVIVGKKTDLHTAVIFIAIFGGLALFGVSGFVLGPVIVAATMFLLRVWKRYVQATA